MPFNVAADVGRLGKDGPQRTASLPRLLRDAAVLFVAGIAVGLIANALSPRGISLRRDYFAGAAASPRAATAPAAATAQTSPALANGMDAARRARLAERGIGVADHASAVKLFRDPSYAAGRILFVDARDDAHYQAGHIRGAWQLDHYRLDRYVTDILGAAALAEHIVVYCNGGACEDSELAANDLLQLGVPATKLLVYAGGITEWRAQGMPIETGPRNGLGARP